METNPAKKTCKICCMEIQKEARKCPFCHHFQTRLSTVMFHPAFAILFAFTPFAGILIFLTTIREDYSFRLPANGTSSFKVSFRREFPEANYVKPVISVVGAKDARARW